MLIIKCFKYLSATKKKCFK